MVHRVPAKTTNTSLCAAIDKDGVVSYQIFDAGLHNEDFLGFMSNLVNCLKFERNTSFDEAQDFFIKHNNTEHCGIKVE